MADGSAPLKRKRPPGRPTDYNPSLADQICTRMICGESLRSICDEDAMPDKSTVLRWVDKHEEFRDQYARAQEIAAESDADDVAHYARQAARGEIEPAAATAAINGLKWSSGKRNPKRYGDKLAHTGHDGGALQIEQKRTLDLSLLDAEQRDMLKALLQMAMARQLEAPRESIEGEYEVRDDE